MGVIRVGVKKANCKCQDQLVHQHGPIGALDFCKVILICPVVLRANNEGPPNCTDKQIDLDLHVHTGFKGTEKSAKLFFLPFSKLKYPKRTELAPNGSKVSRFQKGSGVQERKYCVTKVISVCNSG